MDRLARSTIIWIGTIVVILGANQSNYREMKFIYSLVAVLAFTFAGFSQKGVYVKYDTEINASGEEGEMMAMMMNGSTMEVASSAQRTWVKNTNGNHDHHGKWKWILKAMT